MNRYLILFLSFLFLATACTGIKSSSRGLENEAYLEFIGNPDDYSDGIVVQLGDDIEFTAEVQVEKRNQVSGKVYAVPTGTHTVSIYYRDQLIYENQIFVSNQETKRIYLQ